MTDSKPGFVSFPTGGARALFALLVFWALACDPPAARADDAAPSFTDRALGVFGLGGAKKDKEKSAGPAKEGPLQGCPEVMVDGGAPEVRVPPGAEATAVRYQITLGRTARECERKGDDLSVKLGVEGAVVLGPLGQPGSYSGNLRVALRRKRDDQLFGARNLKVGATVPAGGARADFSLVIDDLAAPFVSVNTFDDYEIIIGFTQEGSSANAPAPKKRRKGA